MVASKENGFVYQNNKKATRKERGYVSSLADHVQCNYVRHLQVAQNEFLDIEAAEGSTSDEETEGAEREG